MGHRRWLEANHPFRFQKDLFDDTIELRSAPIPLTGTEVFKQMHGTNYIPGKVSKCSKKRGREHVGSTMNEGLIAEVAEDVDKFFENEDSVYGQKNDDDSMTASTQKQLWKKRVPDGSSAPKQVYAIVSQLSSFFKALCSKVLDPKELDQLESNVALTLCHMEKIFPPGFFTIMVQLLIHLAAEAKLGGSVHYRWMYPIERFLVRLKDYVRNRAYPEGSIAEGYIAEECLTFCSRYLEGIETVFNRPQRNCDIIENAEVYKFSSGGRVLGKVESVVLDQKSLAQAHRYVLLHSDIISESRREFLIAQGSLNHNICPTPRIEQRWLVELFPEWLFKQVPVMMERNCSEELIVIARGPNNIVNRYDGFIINGFKFHTQEREKFRKTQNSGVIVEI
ncbi:uncharacterized protein LOC120105500 [Phoenix dactylifera]|uniref:Uncharacterized protein LOC120105500 n=1 Tax=Phoenix dactylifera TaxID=42345 RepID=A0A8B8ZKY9_PHODC|nr:uncharacterized protein LOC120105500 [Phoenix dactylifera]